MKKNVKGLMKCYLLSTMLVFPILFKQLINCVEEEKYHRLLNLRKTFLSSDASLEDLYKNYLEDKKELSSEAILALSALSECCDGDEYIDLLEINQDTVYDAYANFIDFEPEVHRNSYLYDADSDNIYWNKAVTTIIKNSTAFGNGSNITLGEIRDKVLSLKAFVEELRLDFPDYDMEMLACNLEDCVIKKEDFNDPNDSNVLARVSNNQIIYNEKKENDIDQLVDFHEDFHYCIQSCEDVSEQDSFSRSYDGIHIATCFLKGPAEYDYGSIFRFRYTFLEEAYAEIYAARVLSREMRVYQEYREVLYLFQLILGLQENYAMSNILENLVYQDPISFIQNFSVYGEDPEECFIQNCQLLKACDILFTYDKNSLSILENQEMVDDFSTKGIGEVKKFIMDRFATMFYQNLIILNENFKDDISLEDNITMMNLFDKYQNRANQALTDYAYTNYGGDYFHYYYTFDPHVRFYKDTMITYLSQKYHMEFGVVSQAYDINFIHDDYQFPEVLGEEKQAFYQTLLDEPSVLVKK